MNYFTAQKWDPIKVDHINRETDLFSWYRVLLHINKIDINDSPLFGNQRSKQFITVEPKADEMAIAYRYEWFESDRKVA